MVKLTHQPIMMMNGVLIQTQAGLFASLCVLLHLKKHFEKKVIPSINYINILRRSRRTRFHAYALKHVINYP